MSKKSIHIVPNAQGGWSVRKTGAGRASKVFDTKEDAIEFARSEARVFDSELFIHKRDGTISRRETHSHAIPPKGKR